LEANNTLTLFYQQNCVYVQNNADQNDQQATGDRVVQSASDSTGTVDNLGLWLGIVGSIVGLAGFITGIIIWFKRAVSFAKHPRFRFPTYTPQRAQARDTGEWKIDPPPPPYSKKDPHGEDV
jgi:hypothetical protein